MKFSSWGLTNTERDRRVLCTVCWLHAFLDVHVNFSQEHKKKGLQFPAPVSSNFSLTPECGLGPVSALDAYRSL